jgi:predicted GIY-YIG superfamily endonuclease
MYFAYVIRSEEGHVYTGHTSDPESRLIRHNAGKTPFTRRGREWLRHKTYESHQTHALFLGHGAGFDTRASHCLIGLHLLH